MTKQERQELVSKVADLNNHPANINIDHLTFTGFFDTRAEFERHISKLEEYIKEYESKPAKTRKNKH
jgi:uncharacterized protein YutD